MAVNDSYLLVAENLTMRNKNRLNETRSPREQETDELFYWIMSRLEWSMRGSYPAKTSHSVTIKIQAWYNDGRVLLSHGNVDTYLSRHVKGEEFYAVMKDVAGIFNKIGKSESKGYHFYATCILPSYITKMYDTDKLTVCMITEK